MDDKRALLRLAKTGDEARCRQKVARLREITSGDTPPREMPSGKVPPPDAPAAAAPPPPEGAPSAPTAAMKRNARRKRGERLELYRGLRRRAMAGRR